MKFEKIKTKLKKHSPDIFMNVLTYGPAVLSLVMAGIYAKKIRDFDSVQKMTEDWPAIKIHPSAMENVKNGATLMYRQCQINKDHVYTQSTTLPGGFSDEMNKLFENGGRES